MALTEGIAFYVTLAADGECAADRVAVWRAYNNGFKPQQGINDGNHRFATDHAITHRLADFGWNDEGIVFCAMADDAVRAVRLCAGVGPGADGSRSRRAACSSRWRPATASPVK